MVWQSKPNQAQLKLKKVWKKYPQNPRGKSNSPVKTESTSQSKTPVRTKPNESIFQAPAEVFIKSKKYKEQWLWDNWLKPWKKYKNRLQDIGLTMIQPMTKNCDTQHKWKIFFTSFGNWEQVFIFEHQMETFRKDLEQIPPEFFTQKI